MMSFEKKRWAAYAQQLLLGRLVTRERSPRQAAREVDGDDDWLPLHRAAWNNAEPTLAQQLVEAYPEAAREQGAWRTAAMQLTNRLLELYPGAVHERDKLGNLPLHLALYNRADPELVLRLLEMNPEAACEAARSGGGLPLHCALESKAQPDLAVVRRLLALYPQAVHTANSYGAMPLHIALGHTAPAPALIGLLVAAHPNAVCQGDSSGAEQANGSLPLHLALRNRAHPQLIVVRLLEAFPQAARERGSDGCLPLHLAIRCRLEPALVRRVLEAFPQAVSEPDALGNLPLHLALMFGGCEVDDAEGLARLQLLEVCPEAARKKGWGGCLPLHLALGNPKVASELIAALLLAYPEGPAEMVTKSYLNATTAEAVALISAATGRRHGSPSVQELYQYIGRLIGPSEGTVKVKCIRAGGE